LKDHKERGKKDNLRSGEKATDLGYMMLAHLLNCFEDSMDWNYFKKNDLES
jgi:hypothetical protein